MLSIRILILFVLKNGPVFIYLKHMSMHMHVYSKHASLDLFLIIVFGKWWMNDFHCGLYMDVFFLRVRLH